MGRQRMPDMPDEAPEIPEAVMTQQGHKVQYAPQGGLPAAQQGAPPYEAAQPGAFQQGVFPQQGLPRQGLPRQGADAKGFFAALFDFSFTSLVTTRIIKVLYALILVLAFVLCSVFTTCHSKLMRRYRLSAIEVARQLRASLSKLPRIRAPDSPTRQAQTT